ncbi:glyceraldehyde-3-phosphate dehydrogenase [Bdellovibrio sp. HCB2-146]|uniref:glyceraldehyde-3-phosphate dehydrogenase n=1 Tax=Bdellovibrio sp. HCB2-146 TaxID=3394362 RepID=UPI0039BCD2AC
MNRGILWGLAIAIHFVVSSSFAESIFIDPEDGYLDGSRWLLEHSGFLPVPIIITEPAVGVGGGLALVFMEKNKDAPRPGHFSPPTITGVGAFGTDNQSWGGFGFYIKNWDQDRWRYMGGVGYASLNLTFYGFGGFPGVDDLKMDYNLKGAFLVQDLRHRLGESNFFYGGRYLYSDLEAKFEGDKPEFLVDKAIENRNGGLAILGNYDSRDNTLSPQSGLLSELRYYFFSENFGGDLDYNLGAWDTQGYFKWSEAWGASARLLGKWINGSAPFYAKPYIDLRGIAKQRYQGDYALSTEVELRWRPHPRWQYSVFGGAGKAVTDTEQISDSETAGTYGAGFRYLIARLVGFQMGIDIARGPDETVFYIQAGTAWF